MRFKYKKLIIMFTIAIMFIGLGTFSLVAPSVDFASGKRNADSITDSANTSTNSSITNKKIIANMSESEIKTAISSLVKDYLDAKQHVDMDRLAECVNAPDRIDNKRLLAEAKYIEEYRNIECTIKKGNNNGTYRVYAYYDVKIYDIDTLIPSLVALYIKSDDKGFKIYLGTVDDDAQDAITKLDNSEEVKQMVNSVQKRLEEIASTNEEVRNFCEMLEGSDENIDKETTKSK